MSLLCREGIQWHQLLRFQAAMGELQTSYAVDMAPPEPPSRGAPPSDPSPLLDASQGSLQRTVPPQLQLLKEQASLTEAPQLQLLKGQAGLAEAISVEARADSVAAQLQGAAPLLRSLQASTLRRPRDAPSRSVLGPAPEAEFSPASWRDSRDAVSSEEAPHGGSSAADADAGAVGQPPHEARADASPMADHAEPRSGAEKGSAAGEQRQEEGLAAAAASAVTESLMATAQPTSSHQQDAFGCSLLLASQADSVAAASAMPTNADGPGTCLPASDAETAPMHPLQPQPL